MRSNVVGNLRHTITFPPLPRGAPEEDSDGSGNELGSGFVAVSFMLLFAGFSSIFISLPALVVLLSLVSCAFIFSLAVFFCCFRWFLLF